MTIVKLLSLQIKAQTVRVSKWLKRQVNCFAKHPVILLEEPITEIARDRMSTEYSQSQTCECFA